MTQTHAWLHLRGSEPLHASKTEAPLQQLSKRHPRPSELRPTLRRAAPPSRPLETPQKQPAAAVPLPRKHACRRRPRCQWSLRLQLPARHERSNLVR